MTDIDQFESVFRSADKAVFVYQPFEVGSMLVVTDLPDDDAARFADTVRGFLGVLTGTAVTVTAGGEFETIRDLLRVVEAAQPDLVCTYRHLHTTQWQDPFTMGEYVEVLTQATTHPILVLPHPRAEQAAHALQNTDMVMAITDHLTGDHALVNRAARFTAPGGRLILAHIEDESTFERYLGVISRIPELDTRIARETIRQQLLKEPADYIESCRRGLAEAGVNLEVEPVVEIGRRLLEYRRLVEQREVDLLILHTKDDDQLAMHGLAYPLCVELREIPLLLL